jgi:hypothetical protein
VTKPRLLALLALAGCTAPPMARDLDGAFATPLIVPAGSVHVLVFTSHECPIANAYAPALQELADAWSGQPVRLFVVHVDPQLTPTAARAHAAAYQLPGTILLDPEQRLARELGITRTPEAAVLTGNGLVYRGRIDDQWHALGARSAATSRDLADAVAAARAGNPVRVPFPPAVGCLLPEPAAR